MTHLSRLERAALSLERRAALETRTVERARLLTKAMQLDLLRARLPLLSAEEQERATNALLGPATLSLQAKGRARSPRA